MITAQSLNDLETPTPVVDLSVVEHNLQKMQDYCDRHGMRLRPHIKTHKLPALAKWQIDLGAKGITCQKLSEAEVMMDAGIDDILISYPMIGPEKARRLAKLAPRARLIVAADSPLAVETAAQAASLAGAPIHVHVEFDSGMGRTGVVTVDEALTLARAIDDNPLLVFAGLMTYPASRQTREFVAAARPVFNAANIAIPMISGGGTPHAFETHELGCIDELRVGTYIYHDRSTVSAGAAGFADCALHVLATVISRPTADRAIIDAGTKTLTSDGAGPGNPGFGLLIDYPDAVIEKLSEEHGIISLPGNGPKPSVGEKVLILPNHVCPVSNLHDRLTVVTLDGNREEWPVAARGKTR